MRIPRQLSSVIPTNLSGFISVSGILAVEKNDYLGVFLILKRTSSCLIQRIPVTFLKSWSSLPIV